MEQKLLAEDLVPKALDLRAPGEEAMTPEVEAKAVPHLCSRHAPDPGLGFEHTTPWPARDSRYAAVIPAGPAPRTATDSFDVRVIRGSLPSPGGRGDLPWAPDAAVRRFTAAPAAMAVRPAEPTVIVGPNRAGLSSLATRPRRRRVGATRRRPGSPATPRVRQLVALLWPVRATASWRPCRSSRTAGG
jgi:hypothetical protein